MSVRREYWGRGLGAHLLDAMIAWARTNGHTRKIKLRVQANNERAIALYRSRGFVTEGVLKREFRVDGEWVDTLMMALWLDETT
ncbi:Spermidine N(1)-acetyltransferase [compost metagenome]